MRNFLPNSGKARFLLAFLMLLGITGAYFLFPSKRQQEEKNQIVRAAVEEYKKRLEKLSTDTDGDGLKDWEERVFRTAENNPDTDGDGTDDKTEINTGRDPLVKGPNDKILSEEMAAGETGSATFNVTRDFASAVLKEPITKIIAGAQPNLDVRMVETYTNRLLSQSVLADAPQMKLSEVKLTQTKKDVMVVKAYFEEFASVFKKLNSTKDGELAIVLATFQSQEYEKLQTIEARTQAYAQAIASLKKISAPDLAGELHLYVLNYLLKAKYSAELMQNAEHDPIRTMLAINERLRLDEEFGTYIKTTEGKIRADFENLVMSKK